jgi:hypothetical protein
VVGWQLRKAGSGAVVVGRMISGGGCGVWVVYGRRGTEVGGGESVQRLENGGKGERK